MGTRIKHGDVSKIKIRSAQDQEPLLKNVVLSGIRRHLTVVKDLDARREVLFVNESLIFTIMHIIFVIFYFVPNYLSTDHLNAYSIPYSFNHKLYSLFFFSS